MLGIQPVTLVIDKGEGGEVRGGQVKLNLTAYAWHTTCNVSDR